MHSIGRTELLVTVLAFKVLGFLVVDENFFVFELSFTVPKTPVKHSKLL